MKKAEIEIAIAKAREEYIYGVKEGEDTRYPTLKELSEKYGISFSTLAKRSMKEGWTQKRTEYIQQVERKRMEERAKRASQEIEEVFSEYTDNLKKLSMALLGATGKMLKELSQSGELTTKDLRALVQSLKDLAVVGALLDKGADRNTVLAMEGLGAVQEIQAKVFKAVRQALKDQAVKHESLN